jgi:hypothetical protein
MIAIDIVALGRLGWLARPGLDDLTRKGGAHQEKRGRYLEQLLDQSFLTVGALLVSRLRPRHGLIGCQAGRAGCGHLRESLIWLPCGLLLRCGGVIGQTSRRLVRGVLRFDRPVTRISWQRNRRGIRWLNWPRS